VGSHRLLIVSASMGAGHDAAAGALAARAREQDVDVRIIDLLALPRLHQGDLLRAYYHGMIAIAPGLYDWAMRRWLDHPGLFETITGRGGRSAERGLLEIIDEFRPDAAVAVYNLAGQVLGRLRSQGRLHTPVATYVTDPGAHPYWIWPGVDLHLAPMPATASALEGMGAEVVKPVAPLVADHFLHPPDRQTARERWRLPADARVVLVNGGSWGVGHLTRAAAELTGGVDLVLVLCGRSDGLRRRIDAIPGARAIPWTRDVVGLLAAADVVVDNAGGTTCWEALAAGRPIVVHRPIAGHGRLNAVALAEAGLAQCTTRDDELIAAVRAAEPPAAAAAVFGGPHAADVVTTLW
jgi:UDP-N-acetylglucosamine:LPS N-acetylglucosamine transferase